VTQTVAQLIEHAAHAGDLAGADRVGEAEGGERLVVRIGIWLSDGKIARARFRATTCASLIAYAEAACRLLEGAAAPPAIDADLLRRSVQGVNASHLDRATLVLAAVPREPRNQHQGGLP
jgi:NifU-like protein involved in Fe-S cluster formation